MSHHFDTETARTDPRLNLTDLYLFRARPGFTVMAMATNPAATEENASFHEEGLYAFRFDVDGDAREELTFKIRFGEVVHEDGAHRQSVRLLRGSGQEAFGGDGEVLAEGATGMVVDGPQQVRLYAGIAADMFFGNRAGLHKFRDEVAAGRFDPHVFDDGVNFFDGRNVTAIVVEVPNELIGEGTVHAWATISLFGHAPEEQVSRWGKPLITQFYFADDDVKERYNRSAPTDDATVFAQYMGDVIERMTTLAGSAESPAGYRDRALARLIPTTLPYEVGSWAAYNFADFNGRGFSDDVMDVQLSLMTNSAFADGVAIPAKTRMRAEFPYFGEANPTE
jgi:hypothetical protein